MPKLRIPTKDAHKYDYVCSNCYIAYMGDSNRPQQTFVNVRELVVVEKYP